MPRQPRSHLKGLKVKGLTRQGKNWLINALDPFHDTQVPFAGYPDMNSSRTLIYQFESELVITPPASVANGAAWDCHIFALPEMAAMQYLAVAGNPTTTGVTLATGTAVAANAVALGTLNVATMAAGSPTFVQTSTNAVQTSTYNYLSPPATYIAGTSRVVAMGYEVYNTTPENYIGGSVSYYRSPQTIDESQRSLYNGSYTLTGQEIKSRMVPNTIADVHNLIGSVKGAAKDGAYIVCTANSDINPLSEGDAACSRSFLSKNAGDVYTETGLTSWGGGTQQPGPVTTKPIAIDSSGAYFTNLPYQTSLNVVLRMNIEYVPTINDLTLVKMTSPSPPLDMIALQCYGRAISTLKIGVPVGENPLGEWFNRVVDAIGNYGGSVGAMFGPEGAILGKAASTAAKAYQGIAKKTNQKMKSLNEKENKVARQVKTLATKVNTMTKNKAATKKKK